jgi:hypothetical protein
MNLAPLQPHFSLVVAIVYAILLVLGILYALLIAWAETNKYLEGYTAFAVALGVLFTLGGVAIVSWQAALLTLGAFVASGTPMIVGSTISYAAARRKEQEYERQAAGMAGSSEGSPR